jgi:hypothetical protein
MRISCALLALAAAAAASLPACVTNLQQHAAFAAAAIGPRDIPAAVGDVVPFEVLPAVPAGSEWGLDTHGYARFRSETPQGHLTWTADGKPILLEALVTPFDPDGAYQREAHRGWLWFGLRDSGASQSIDQDLPIARAPFKQLAIVEFTSEFSLEKRPDKILVSETENRIVVRYKTVNEKGTPLAPRVRPLLLETQGKKRLYVEVWTNFGDRPRDPLGYEVTMKYPKSVTGRVDVIVAEWIGHGPYYSPFQVTRTVIGGAPGEAKPPAETTTTIPSQASPTPPAEER